jgi:hypothetical protein
MLWQWTGNEIFRFEMLNFDASDNGLRAVWTKLGGVIILPLLIK